MEDFPPLCPPPPLNPLATPFLPPSPSPLNHACSSWSKKLFNLPHIPENRRLAYFAPTSIDGRLVAVCSKDEVELTANSWKGAVQGFFAGKRPYVKSVLMALERVWKLQGTMEVFPRPDDSIIFNFSSSEDRKMVLELGPWFILGRYFHLRPWSRDISSKKEFFGSMPIWVRLPNLPLHFWSIGSISRIASAVGKPLFLDEKSANASKLQFVRICVEASAHGTMPKSISMEVEGGVSRSFEQQIEYESSFLICSKCETFGHTVESCEEACRIKSTLKIRRRQTKNQLDVEEFAERQVLQDANIGATNQTNDNVSKVSEPAWKMVTKKRKNRKKKSGITSKSRCNESAQILSKQDDRNAGANQSKFKALLPESGNPPDIVDNNEDPPTQVASESREFFLEQDPNTPPENQIAQVVSLQLERPANSGAVMISQEEKRQSEIVFPWEGLEELTETGPYLIEHHNREEGLEVHKEQNGIEETEKEDPSCQTRSDPVATTPVDKDVTEGRLPATENGYLNELAPHGYPFCHFESLTDREKSADDYTLDNLEPGISGPPTQARLGLDTLESHKPIKPAGFIEAAQTSPFNHPPPSHTQAIDLLVDDFEDNDSEMSFPPGFTPSKEDILTLRELMKEGMSSVPPEYQSDFLRTVDSAEDGEIVEFFQEKFKETTRENEDTNFVTFHNVRRSPRIKKAPARLSSPNSSSGLKKGFIK